MKTQVEFRSDAFPPYEDESDEINPGRFGKRVAEYLQAELNVKGFKTNGPFSEDWGWLVEVQNAGFRLWFGCGNVDGTTNEFLVFIEPQTPSVRPFPFLKKFDTIPRVKALQTAIDELLASHPDVRNIQWQTDD